MLNNPNTNTTNDFSKNAVEAAIKIGLLALLLSWCFHIVHPFITPLVWGMIIAVALNPVYKKLVEIFGQRDKLAAILITALLILIIIGPAVILAGSRNCTGFA